MNIKIESPLYFIAIGGAGMAPLAMNFLSKNFQVAGSDIANSDNLSLLKQAGAKIYNQHKAEQIMNAKTIIVSSAIKQDNPELKEAKRRRINVIHRSDALAYLINNSYGICVAGTHGKTSSSALTSIVLAAGGLNPRHVIGSVVPDLKTYSSNKKSNWIVAEADESDGSFIKYKPLIGIITNIEADHLDFYVSEDRIYGIFQKFIDNTTKSGGTIICCTDDTGVKRTLSMLSGNIGLYHKSIITYGFQKADVLIKNVVRLNQKSKFTLLTSNTKLSILNNKNFIISLPGKHSIYNTVSALIVGALTNVSIYKTKLALETFKGALRRFTLHGKINGIYVYDDYAHHPTEIISAIDAARQIAQKNYVKIIFQPHLYSRTLHFAKDFAKTLDMADECIVLDVYKAREKYQKNISGKTITQYSKKAKYIPNKHDAVKELCKNSTNGDVLITMGAGDVNLLGSRIINLLKGD